MWDFVDKVVYINLDRRKDRDAKMKDFFVKGGIPNHKIVRFSAIDHPVGIVGCGMSHIRVLNLAKQSAWKNVLIFEDDVEWHDFNKNYAILETLVKTPRWDVCMLGGWYADLDGYRVTSSICAHAYLVQSSYYNTLLANFEEGLQLKLSHLGQTDIFHVDVYWIKLQMRDIWLAIPNQLCVQRQDFSNIRNKQEKSKLTIEPEVIVFARTIKQMFQSGVIYGVIPKNMSSINRLFGMK